MAAASIDPKEPRDSAAVGVAQPALEAGTVTSQGGVAAQQAGGTVPRANAELLSGGQGTGDGAGGEDTLRDGGVPAPDLSADESTAAAEVARALSETTVGMS